MNAVKEKKLPMRKCAGCGEHFAKGELIRVLRTPEGAIVLDATGRANGRGAYLCRKAECLRKARKARRLETSLDCRIPDEVYQRLEEELIGTI